MLEALWKAVLEVSKTAQARAKNACPEPKSTHHLSPVLTFIVLDCSAICLPLFTLIFMDACYPRQLPVFSLAVVWDVG